MFLIARNINNTNYLTVYSDKAIALQRLSVFENDGDHAFVIEVDNFDYCTPNGLMADCPDFSHLIVDYKKKAISWNVQSIARELEAEKSLAIDNVIELAYADKVKQEKNEIRSGLTGISALSVNENVISKYKPIINSINSASSKVELECIYKELTV